MTVVPFSTGFQFEVSREELVTHLKKRAQAHVMRATELENKASSIRDTGTVSEEDMQVLDHSPLSNAGPYGPASMVGMAGIGNLGGNLAQHRSQVIQAVIQTFTSRAKNNRRRAAELEFYATHVPTNKNSFLVTRAELDAFEFFEATEWVPFMPSYGQAPGDEPDDLEGLG
jgi:hypothetical protein